MEKEDIETSLTTLGARKDHPMDLHQQFQMGINAADLAKDASPEELWGSDSDSEDDESDSDDDSDDSDSDSDWFAEEMEAGPINLAADEDEKSNGGTNWTWILTLCITCTCCQLCCCTVVYKVKEEQAAEGG